MNSARIRPEWGDITTGRLHHPRGGCRPLAPKVVARRSNAPSKRAPACSLRTTTDPELMESYGNEDELGSPRSWRIWLSAVWVELARFCNPDSHTFVPVGLTVAIESRKLMNAFICA